MVTLQTSMPESTNGPSILVPLLLDDQNALKQVTTVATNNNNTYLTVLEGAFLDMSNVPGLPILDTMALQVSNFTADLTRPRLTRFGLNLTTDVLTLYFSGVC